MKLLSNQVRVRGQVWLGLCSKLYRDGENILVPYCQINTLSVIKCINHDLRLRDPWFRANRIFLNVDETEIILFVLFRPQNKTIGQNMNFRRYSGILTDQHLSWEQHLKMLKQKLSRTNGSQYKQLIFSPKIAKNTLLFYILIISQILLSNPVTTT